MSKHLSAQSCCHDVDFICALTNVTDHWAKLPKHQQVVQSLVTPILQLISPKVDDLRKEDVAKARRLVEIAAHLAVSTLANSGIDIDKQKFVNHLHDGSPIK